MAAAERTRGARREQLLATATRLASEAPGEQTPWSNAVRVISPRDAAAALGLSRTWAYQLWPSREDFSRDLALHECRRPDLELAAFTRIGPAPVPATQSGRAIDGLVERLDWLCDQVAMSRRSASYAAVFGYQLPEEAARLTLMRIEQAVGRLEEWLGEWLQSAGRRPAEGLDVHDLAEIVHLCVEGTRLVRLVAPWLLERRLPVAHSPAGAGPLAALVVALLDECTEPGKLEAAGPVRSPQLPEHGWSDRQCLALEASSSLLDATAGDPHERIVAFGWVTAARLARETGTNRHTVYHYWSSDDELRIAVLERICEQYQRVIARWMASWTAPDRPEDRPPLHRFMLLATVPAGSHLPYLGFLPHLGNPRVAAALHGIHRFALEQIEQVVGVRGRSHLPFDDAQRAGLLLMAWYGARRRFMLMSAAGDPGIPRLSELYGRIARPLIGSASGLVPSSDD